MAGYRQLVDLYCIYMFDVTPCFHIEEVLLKFILLLTAPRESDHLLHIATHALTLRYRLLNRIITYYNYSIAIYLSICILY